MNDITLERHSALLAWARLYGGPMAAISGVTRLSGHGGETLAFDLVSRGERVPLVVRLAPTGVPRRASTDVLRQAPLLRALGANGVPVAAVIDEVSEDGPFATDALIQVRLDGQPLSLFPPAPAPVAPVSDHLRQATEALAGLHALDHTAVLPGWDVPQSPRDVVERWALLIPKQPETTWSEGAAQLAEELRHSCPEDAQLGICHGDYQTNNVLFGARGDLVGIVDWELAHIGPTPLDVAWLAMMADPLCWGEPYRSQLLVTAEPGVVFDRYADAGGRLADLDWYFALSCFRYAVICGHNVRLHRTGRRPDPFNRDLAATVPVLLDRGLTTLRA